MSVARGASFGACMRSSAILTVMSTFLLQAGASDFFRSVALPLAGLLAFAVAGWFAVVAVRKAYRGDDASAAPFTLEDLRRLHRAGELSDEEYARAREAMIGGVRRQTREGAEPKGMPVRTAPQSDRAPSHATDVRSQGQGRPPGAPIRPAGLDGPTPPRADDGAGRSA